MEKVYFPLSYLDVGEKSNEIRLDLKSPGYKENIYAPFDGIIRKVYKIGGNYVWLESSTKVLWADGSVDYMVLFTGGDDNVESLYVGKQISKGMSYYTQGKGDNSLENHVVLEVGKGQFHGNGWEKREDGEWHIYDAVDPCKAFILGNKVQIKKESPYSFIREDCK